ncbi:hypothetical protein BU23DRAFT_564002 [Bimuria novae-zelandiae CBS 107.79]|uniref:Uncharacterized protein n=1 Tax=Bimuria novae-zelandiae CBS 107.79 TaxID=1447943 RepID=A0A6A5VMA7_9PLEO|nr:hypothetical protein BU23DRAFT_564002 [Bimuria novae-zelandiae CBS 107.79]
MYVEDMIFFGLACDEYSHAHPRLIVQNHFCLIIMAVYGLRPGEFVEAGNHRGSGEGLAYGDMELSLHYHKGVPRYQLRMQLRYRKRYRGELRDQDNLLLYEETHVSRRAFCPVVHFLALALADDVFTELSLPHLQERKIPIGSNSHRFAIKEDKKDLSILRMFTGRPHRKGQIVAASSFYHQILELGRRCGYEKPISAYCFRRGFQNGIDGHISAAKQRQLMGHASDKTGQSYIAPTVAVDTQRAIRGEAQDREYIELASSIANTRDLTAPISHLGRMAAHPPLVTEDEIKEMATKFPKSPNRELARRVRKAKLNRARRLHFDTSPQETLGDLIVDNRPRVGRIQPTPSRHL